MAIVGGLGVWTACVLHGAQSWGAERKPSERFQRPEAKVIHAEVNRILKDARFAPRKSFMQWLAEKLSAWRGPDVKLPRGLLTVLAWVFVIWAVLTLLAILAHLAWTLVTLYGSGRGGRRGGRIPGRRAGRRPGELSSDELLAEMQRLAELGRFREALGMMMLVLLRRLDERGIVRFNPGKTNGDYVREYPSVGPGREEFQSFSGTFDVLVYGGGSCRQETYRNMQSLFEQVQSHVRTEPQV